MVGVDIWSTTAQPLVLVLSSSATMSLASSVSGCPDAKWEYRGSIPVETQNLAENQDQDHANEDPGLLHVRAHA